MRFISNSGAVKFRVKVVPGASRQRIVGAYGEGIKVAVTAAPQRGAANEAVIELLAETLGIAQSAIRITAGSSNPRKEIAIVGLSAEEIERRLLGNGSA